MLKKHWCYKQNAISQSGHVFEWSRFDTISPRFQILAHDFIFALTISFLLIGIVFDRFHCWMFCFVLVFHRTHANTHLIMQFAKRYSHSVLVASFC